MSDYFLGVDGGQSSTVAVIGDETGRVVGWAAAGPCNHVAAHEGRGKFMRVMGECVSGAAERAGLAGARPRFRSACLGMSGGPEDKTLLLSELIDSEEIEVTHDGRIALAGAHGGEPGGIVIAGTGSFAFGENAQRQAARAGGWGYVFGDEGGGFDIVRQAVRAMLREHEGWGPATALTPALLEATGTRDANEAVHLFYTAEWPRSRVATLATVVDRVAEAGDAAAKEILQTAAQHLAVIAASVRRQLWKAGEPSRLAWVGGAFRSAILLERFQTLVELEGSVSAGPPLLNPAMGALVLAWRAAGCAALPGQIPLLKD